MNKKVVVGLPAYNEGAVLPQLLQSMVQLREQLGEGRELEIVVINDGSTDDTESILQEYSRIYPFLNYISHPHNQGLGRAMRTLLRSVSEQYKDGDILITLDADNTHSPQLIPGLLDKLEKEGLDLVIASRFTPGGKEIGLALHRKICSRGAGLFLKTFFPIRNVRDYSCGFRAYRIGYLKKAMAMYGGEIVTSAGFECMAEILARFSKIGVSVGEYPLELHYERKKGRSKMNLPRTIMGYFRLLKVVKKPLVH